MGDRPTARAPRGRGSACLPIGPRKETASRLGALVCHQPGLRIGIVVSDQTTLVYTPTPLLIEPGAESPARSNGILLSSPPPSLASELGIGPEAHVKRTLGMDQVPDGKVKAVGADLEANPPMPFDISRPVLVFNSQVEFVEFNLEKIQLQRQEIPIPAEVMGLAASNIHSLFRLEVGDDLIAKKVALEEKKRDIEKKFTRPMRGFGGSIIRRSQKKEFSKAVAGLESELESFQKVVKREFDEVAETNMRRLVELLLPRLKEHPPNECLEVATEGNLEKHLQIWLLDQLRPAFFRVAKVADEMRVTVRFKGVTIESLRNPDFRERAREAFPDLQLHEEFSAAREKESPPTQPQLKLL